MKDILLRGSRPDISILTMPHTGGRCTIRIIPLPHSPQLDSCPKSVIYTSTVMDMNSPYRCTPLTYLLIAMANDDKGTLHKPLTDLKHLNFVLRHQILFLPALWILFSVYGVGYIFISTTAIVLTTPIVLHLIYPTLFYQSIIADLQKPMGISLVFCASVVAVLLQPGPRARESAAFLRVMVLIEFLHNGSPTEKEQVTSYLRWIKRAGLSDERTAEMIEIVTWILLGFEERFGYKMSPRRKDALVMQSRCSGLRIGVPVDLLATDYDSLNARFSSLPGLQDIARRDELVLRASSASSFFVKFASLIALDLLPGNLSGSIRTSLSRLFGSKVLLWGFNSFMWLIYPLLAWIPLRTIIGLVTFTHSKSRLAINVCLGSWHVAALLNPPICSLSWTMFSQWTLHKICPRYPPPETRVILHIFLGSRTRYKKSLSSMLFSDWPLQLRHNLHSSTSFRGLHSLYPSSNSYSAIPLMH
ncbi:hypothetical protein DL96DRAFT_996197 [Flagelloscypha sp. PMI_526]|nr:hypothetical protein DL96DRAFT_996197 [Flagelloscypha sp. PMI_526]